MLYINKRDGVILDISEQDMKYLLPNDLRHLQKFEEAFKGDKLIKDENTIDKSKRDSRAAKGSSGSTITERTSDTGRDKGAKRSKSSGRSQKAK